MPLAPAERHGAGERAGETGRLLVEVSGAARVRVGALGPAARRLEVLLVGEPLVEQHVLGDLCALEGTCDVVLCGCEARREPIHAGGELRDLTEQRAHAAREDEGGDRESGECGSGERLHSARMVAARAGRDKRAQQQA